MNGSPLFVPGCRMSSVDGEFIPGLAVRTKAGGFQFLPGLHTGDMYQLGQFVETGDDGEVAFTRGQVIIRLILRTSPRPVEVEQPDWTGWSCRS